MNSEKSQNRQTADEDFRRSLSQLENLLEDKSLLGEAGGEVNKDGAIAANKPSTHLIPDLTEADKANRFGGNLLDAIPLAQRLGSRLATQPPNRAKKEPKSSSQAERP